MVPASAPVSIVAPPPVPAVELQPESVAVEKPVDVIDAAAAPQIAQVQGLTKPIDAASSTNKGPLTAIDPPALQPYLQRTEAYLRRPDLGGYTLQIAAIKRDASAVNYLNFAVHHVDSTMIFAQLTRYNERDFVAVFVGQYASAGEANAALAALPDAIKTNKPMVRTWTKIKQEQPP
jgi:DamX protein